MPPRDIQLPAAIKQGHAVPVRSEQIIRVVFFGVLFDGIIGSKLVGLGNICQTNPSPLLLITIETTNLLLSLNVRMEVFQQEVFVIVLNQGFIDFHTFTLNVWNGAINKTVNYSVDDWIIFIEVT